MFHFPTFPPPTYQFSWQQPGITQARFPHSDTLGSPLASQFPEAYRRLQRPSSAHTHQGIHQTPYNTKKQNTRNSKQNRHHAKSQTNTQPKTKAFGINMLVIKMLTLTMRQPTTTPTPQTENKNHNLANCSQAVNRQASVRMPNSTPNQQHPKHKQALKPVHIPSISFYASQTRNKTIKHTTMACIKSFLEKSLERR